MGQDTSYSKRRWDRSHFGRRENFWETKKNLVLEASTKLKTSVLFLKLQCAEQKTLLRDGCVCISGRLHESTFREEKLFSKQNLWNYPWS